MNICYKCEDGETELDPAMNSIHQQCAAVTDDAIKLLFEIMDDPDLESYLEEYLDRFYELREEMEHLGHGVY